MTPAELPKRSAFIGPRRSVGCDVPIDVMERYLEALHAYEWTATDRSGGGVSHPLPPETTNRIEGAQ